MIESNVTNSSNASHGHENQKRKRSRTIMITFDLEIPQEEIAFDRKLRHSKASLFPPEEFDFD